MDLETRLHTLEELRIKMVKARDHMIREAESMIENANQEFDRVAVPLGREINELRARLQRVDKERPVPEPTRRGRNSHKPPMLDGLDDDEQKHYQQLLARRKAKR